MPKEGETPDIEIVGTNPNAVLWVADELHELGIVNQRGNISKRDLRDNYEHIGRSLSDQFGIGDPLYRMYVLSEAGTLIAQRAQIDRDRKLSEMPRWQRLASKAIDTVMRR